MQILIFWRLRDNAMRSYFEHGPTVSRGREGVGYSKKFSSERLHPEGGPALTVLYTIFDRKGTLSYTFYWQMVPLTHTVGPLLWDTSIERFHSRDQHLRKFMGTKESVCLRKEINSHRTGLEHQHSRRFIVLEHHMMAALTSCENALFKGHLHSRDTKFGPGKLST